jgi:hypothetical protein
MLRMYMVCSWHASQDKALGLLCLARPLPRLPPLRAIYSGGASSWGGGLVTIPLQPSTQATPRKPRQAGSKRRLKAPVSFWWHPNQTCLGLLHKYLAYLPNLSTLSTAHARKTYHHPHPQHTTTGASAFHTNPCHNVSRSVIDYVASSEINREVNCFNHFSRSFPLPYQIPSEKGLYYATARRIGISTGVLRTKSSSRYE